MNFRSIATLLLFTAATAGAQQKVIPLYNGPAPGSESWNWKEGVSEVNAANTVKVYNVVNPSLGVFLPDPAIATGTAVIICPGGSFQTLSINNEGNQEAEWLNKHGVAAFVLKYRVIHSLTNDPVSEVEAKRGSKAATEETLKLYPLALADTRLALTYVREHAAEYGLSPSRIGIMGFSAGGTLAASSAYKYTPANKPNFVALIYPFFPAMLQSEILPDAPPMFIAAASDDDLGLAPHSVDLYSKWLASKHRVELHIYEKGLHGFGMRTQNIPTDTWIERFGDWLGLEGLLKPINPKALSAKEKMAEDEANRKKWEESFHKDWANINRYAAENAKVPSPAPGEKRVLYMGDSITDFWIHSDSSFFAGKPYYDRGISGQTTTQMLVRFRQDVINLKPAVVLILAGINDIAENNGPIKLEDVFGNIVSMAQLAKAANIKVVLSSVLPAYDFPWRPGMNPAPKVASLNAMIREYAIKNKIVYLDYYGAMVDDRKGLPIGLSADGVHPNLGGYKIMEPLAEKAIAEALKR